jgi:hypothetical protein
LLPAAKGLVEFCVQLTGRVIRHIEQRHRGLSLRGRSGQCERQAGQQAHETAFVFH